MSLTELTTIVPPPAHPIDPGDAPGWKTIERLLLLGDIPTDLFDLVHAYGTGFFMVETRNAIKITNPFSDEYWPWVVYTCRIHRRTKESAASNVAHAFPFGVYPDSIGLFPIGTDSDGGTLYWYTEGRSSQWPLLANPPGYRTFERFDMSLTTFLAKSFTGEVHCCLWKNTLEDRPRVFFKSTKSLNPME